MKYKQLEEDQATFLLWLRAALTFIIKSFTFLLINSNILRDYHLFVQSTSTLFK